MADVFWLRDNDTQVTTVLSRQWTGICSPVMMTGQVTVLSTPTLEDNRVRRSLITEWDTDLQVPGTTQRAIRLDHLWTGSGNDTNLGSSVKCTVYSMQ